jgi:hypothetical protein
MDAPNSTNIDQIIAQQFWATRPLPGFDHARGVGLVQFVHLRVIQDGLWEQFRDDFVRPDDTQRQAVYRWASDYAMTDMHFRRRLTYAQALGFVRRVAAEAGVPEPILVMNPDLPCSGETWIERENELGAGVITIRPRQRGKAILLHEISHLVIQWNDVRSVDGRPVGSHGPDFMGVYLHLMARYWPNRRSPFTLSLGEQHAAKLGIEWDYSTANRVLPWLET